MKFKKFSFYFNHLFINESINYSPLTEITLKIYEFKYYVHMYFKITFLRPARTAAA